VDGYESTPVSIVIPSYNREHFLPRALKSAIDQCLPDDELIVVDDGSTDGTERAVEPFRGRVAYIKVKNGGAGKARNIGVQLSKKPLVAFLDSDDEWMPSKLALQRALMAARPDLVFSFSDVTVRFHWGADIRFGLRHRYKNRAIGEKLLGDGRPFSAMAPLPVGVSDFLVHIGNLYGAEMANSHVVTSTMVVRRERAKEALFFAEDLPTYEDWECFGRLAKIGLSAYLDIETAWLHQHEAPQLTKSDLLKAVSSRLKLLSRVWGQDIGYLSEHGAEYEKVVNEQRLIRIRELLKLADTHEARREIVGAKGVPISYRLLTRMPPFTLQTLLSAKKKLIDFRKRP
jgi:glycosyltransferase involved in cell wall biosynthesis